MSIRDCTDPVVEEAYIRRDACIKELKAVIIILEDYFTPLIYSWCYRYKLVHGTYPSSIRWLHFWCINHDDVIYKGRMVDKEFRSFTEKNSQMLDMVCSDCDEYIEKCCCNEITDDESPSPGPILSASTRRRVLQELQNFI